MNLDYNELILKAGRDAFTNNIDKDERQISYIIKKYENYINDRYATTLLPTLKDESLSLEDKIKSLPSLFWSTELGERTIHKAFSKEIDLAFANMVDDGVKNFKLNQMNLDEHVDNLAKPIFVIGTNGAISKDVAKDVASYFASSFTHYSSQLMRCLVENNIIDLKNDSELTRFKVNLIRISDRIGEKLIESFGMEDSEKNEMKAKEHTDKFNPFYKALVKGFQDLDVEFKSKNINIKPVVKMNFGM